MEERALRVVILKEDDMFVAQCLEHDICVQAPDISTLQHRFEDALVLEMQGGDGFDGLPAAPPEFHTLWDAGLGLQSKLANADVRLAA